MKTKMRRIAPLLLVLILPFSALADDGATREEARQTRGRADRDSRAPGSPPEELHRALDDFQAALDGRWSYRHANGADFDGAIRGLRKRIDAGISVNDFGIELQKIIALGIDGHSSVSGYVLPGEGYVPFLVEPVGGRFVAFKPERDGFLAEGFPYLVEIDGKDVADWCTAAAGLVVKGSPQYVQQHCLALLRNLDYLRGLMNLPVNDAVEIQLATPDGKTRKTLSLPVARKAPRSEQWPRGHSRVLEGNIGYLRLPDMNEAAVKDITTWLSRFRDTNGLIVDVRDNGGGIRDPMRLLFSYIAAPDDPPRVFTAAAYRRHTAHLEGHLAQRFMYRADAKEWTADERRAVAAFARTFKARWELPEGQFSAWHFMALSRLDDPAVYHYHKPVVVLMNARNFSASDIFLAGLKGVKNVTLMGTPSGGGSALAEHIALGTTPFRVRLGTMASFQADGTLFDGNGVWPDVVVEPVPEYFIGGQDNVPEEAVQRVKGSAPTLAERLVYPIIANVGGVVPLPNAAEPPRKGARVVIDITADAKATDLNKGLERAARLLNLYGAGGLKAADVRIAVVMHGDATKCALVDSAYQEKFGTGTNPNLAVIGALRKAGVEVFVCGQALAYKGFRQTEVAEGITVAAAALTVVMNRQADGYAYIPAH